jgi:hypothetical protein
MLRKKILLFLLFLMVVSIASAEEIDPAYISRFKTKLNFRLQLNKNEFRYSLTPLSSVNFSDKELKSAQLNYGSFIPFSAGFAFNFMFGGFGYDFRFTKQYFNPSSKPVSDFRNFRLNILGKKIGFEAFYDGFEKNYYNRSEKLFDDILNFSNNLNARHWGLSMRVIANDTRFSYKAAFAQTEFQKKSAASFVLWYGYDQIQFKRNQGLLLDTAVQKYFDKVKYLVDIKQHSWFVMPGFASNLVYKKLYFASAVYVGSGPQFNRQFSDTNISKKVNLPFLSKARASFGINGKSVYTGIFANVDYSRSSFQSLKSEFFNYKIGFFIGLRLIKETKTKEQKLEEKRKKKEDKNKRA